MCRSGRTDPQQGEDAHRNPLWRLMVLEVADKDMEMVARSLLCIKSSAETQKASRGPLNVLQRSAPA